MKVCIWFNKERLCECCENVCRDTFEVKAFALKHHIFLFFSAQTERMTFDLNCKSWNKFERMNKNKLLFFWQDSQSPPSCSKNTPPSRCAADPPRLGPSGTRLTRRGGRSMHHCQAKCGISVSAEPEPPAGPRPHLVSPETAPRPLKARLAIDFCWFFPRRNKETFSVTWYIIITSFVAPSPQTCRPRFRDGPLPLDGGTLFHLRQKLRFGRRPSVQTTEQRHAGHMTRLTRSHPGFA